MPGPKNNLQDVLARQASNGTIGSPPKPVAKTFKFKPAAPSPSVGVSKPRQATPISSSMGRGAPVSSHASRVELEAIVLSSDSSSGSANAFKLPSKRISAEYIPAPSSKRLKNTVLASPGKGKENKVDRTPTTPTKPSFTPSSPKKEKGKSKAPPQPSYYISDDDDNAMDVDLDEDLDNPFTKLQRDFPRLAHKGREPAKEQTMSRMEETPKEHTRSMHGLQPSNNILSKSNQIVLKYPDLADKPLATLNAFLIYNHRQLSGILESVAEYHSGNDKTVDIFTLQLQRDIFKERIAGIEQAIKDRKDPSPFPTFPAASTPTASTRSLSPSIRSIPPSETSFPSSSKLNIQFESVSTNAATYKSPYFNATTTTTSATTTDMTFNDVLDIEDSEQEYWGEEEEELPDEEAIEAALSQVAATSVPDPLARSSTPDESLKRKPFYPEVMRILKLTFKLEAFRTNQLEAVCATLEGRDVFVLMPTGGGKSLCYQLPAVCHTGRTQGVTFVVSPLLALMQDQVNALLRKGVDVILWNSETDMEGGREILSRLSSRKKPSMVYVTPEKLKESKILRDKLTALYHSGELARFVIDEAHCISTWGRDFREAYQELHILREEYPNVPIIALTATANTNAAIDIQNRLKLRNFLVLAQSFNRTNLHYSVVTKPKTQPKTVEAIANWIKSNHAGQCGVIYCFSRKDSEKVAELLKDRHNLDAKHYHAGMETDKKTETLTSWLEDRYKIIVATIAFGMGIDKADVRFVIHYSLPKSLDGYYQETGRAGRDGKPSDCILYYDYADFKKIEGLIRSDDKSGVKPSRESIDRQVTGAREVVQFCSNLTECRRVYVLRYFGEKFSRKDCRKGCDNCMKAEGLTMTDASRLARIVIQLVKSILEATDQVTQNQCLLAFIGSKSKDVIAKQLDKNKFYGQGKMEDRPLLDRVFSELIVREVFELYPVKNSSGWSNSYLRMGHKADHFLQKGAKLDIPFHSVQKSTF